MNNREVFDLLIERVMELKDKDLTRIIIKLEETLSSCTEFFETEEENG